MADRPIAVAYRETPTETREPSFNRSVSHLVDPSAHDRDIAQTIRDMFRIGREARAEQVRSWNRCKRALTAQPRNGPVASSEPNVRIPELWHIVRTAVCLKLDQRIIAKVSPAGPMGTEWHDWLTVRCSDLEAVMESGHFVNKEETQYQRALFDAATLGTGILKTTWDDALANGDGDAVIRRVNPYCFVPDPSAIDMDSCEWMIEARQMSPSAIDRMFPGKGKLFLKSGSHDDIDQMPVRHGPTPGDQAHVIPGPISPATAPRQSKTLSAETLTDVETITVLEAWVREHDVSTVKGGPEDGEEIVTEHWRVIMVANDVILMNERCDELWSHGSHPYDRVVPYDLGDSFWGLSLVELLGPTQAALNRILQAIQRHIEVTGNPILLEDFGALTQQSGWKGNTAGQRVSKRSNKEVVWMTPPPLSAEVPNFMQYLLTRMETISGLSALARGGVPQGRPAQGTVDALQEIAYVGIRGELLNLEAALRGAYYKKASLIAENYTEPRWVSITGPDGQPTSMFLSARHFLAGTDDDTAQLEYIVRVDAGSSSHTSRKVREDKAQVALTLGAISILDYLEAIDWPNPHLAVKRKALEAQSILAANPTGKRERARA